MHKSHIEGYKEKSSSALREKVWTIGRKVVFFSNYSLFKPCERIFTVLEYVFAQRERIFASFKQRIR